MTARNFFIHPFPWSLVIVVALMAFVSIPLHADTYSFYLGPQPNVVPAAGGESLGPYPGKITDTTTNTVVSESPFLCLDGNINTEWGSTLTGTLTAPVGRGEDEAAFLASLLLYDASMLGVTPDQYNHPNPPSPYTPAYATFINSYAAPITFAIWDVMGTLPNGISYPAGTPAGTQAFVNMAQAEYTNVFTNPASPLYAAGQSFLSSVLVFSPIPAGSNQRYLTAPLSTPLDRPYAPFGSVPEPSSLGLIAAGLILVGFGRTRFSGRH